MMDAYNIAVCFGPTLLPVPDGYDQVTTQANVNEIIKVGGKILMGSRKKLVERFKHIELMLFLGHRFKNFKK